MGGANHALSVVAARRCTLAFPFFLSHSAHAPPPACWPQAHFRWSCGPAAAKETQLSFGSLAPFVFAIVNSIFPRQAKYESKQAPDAQNGVGEHPCMHNPCKSKGCLRPIAMQSAWPFPASAS